MRMKSAQVRQSPSGVRHIERQLTSSPGRTVPGGRSSFDILKSSSMIGAEQRFERRFFLPFCFLRPLFSQLSQFSMSEDFAIKRLLNQYQVFILMIT
ncbi:hypothetical protein VTO42DRAFT_5556 [Malbranchea cinnamomea]